MKITSSRYFSLIKNFSFSFIIVILSLSQIASSNVKGDITPPSLISFDFSPKSIDVKDSPQTITFTAIINDDLSGVTDGIINDMGISPTQVRFRSPSGNQFFDVIFSYPENLISGDSLSGEYSYTTQIQRFSESGIWQLEHFFLVDDVGNYEYLYYEQIEELGFPTDIFIESISDTIPPNLLSLDFSPSTIDVIENSGAVTFTINLSDNLSGVSDAQARFFSPSGNQFSDVTFHKDFNRLEGDDLNGIYTNDLIIEKFSESGLWELEYLLLKDNVGNYQYLQKEQIINLNFPTEFFVVSNQDINPPYVESYEFSPKIIDVSEKTKTITFNLHLIDDLSGVTDGIINGIGTSPSQARYQSPSGNQFVDVIFSSTYNLISGNSLDGIFEDSLTIQPCNETGDWELLYLYLVDDVGNSIYLSSKDMDEKGFSTTFSVTTNDSICSLITSDASIGSTVLAVRSNDDFSVGDTILINPGGETEEFAEITGFGSILIKEGLKFPHYTNEIVRLAETNSSFIFLPLVISK